jgi:hypothetical protein
MRIFLLRCGVHKNEKKRHAPQSLFLAEAVFFFGVHKLLPALLHHPCITLLMRKLPFAAAIMNLSPASSQLGRQHAATAICYVRCSLRYPQARTPHRDMTPTAAATAPTAFYGANKKAARPPHRVQSHPIKYASWCSVCLRVAPEELRPPPRTTT